MTTAAPPGSTALATAKWNVSMIPSMLDKVVIVTGSNSGIGFHTALELSRNDATVVLACRSQERAEKAIADIKRQVSTARVEFIQLDLSSLQSVDSFAAAFKSKFDRLDVLVNNAGLMYPAETHTKDGMEMQFAVNHLGHFYLTQKLFDVIKRTHGARIVNVSSVGHRLARPDFSKIVTSTTGKWFYFNEYSVSKLANLLFTYELDRRLRAQNMVGDVLSVAAHPGVSSTELAPRALLGYLPRFIQMPLCKVLEVLPIFQSAAQGAIPILFAATSRSVQSGDYYGPNGFSNFWGAAPVKETSSAMSYSEEFGTRLWWISEDVAKCKFTV
ncbi:hypothetical protein ATCC90586_002550 [Pythium insidiosum]|nr:hypothetical protein ATCC90586_002550 [Pythium insidiosum]